MILAFRFATLILLGVMAHFGDGLAFIALAAAGLIGWRRWGFFWLALPIVALTLAANRIYANVSGSDKLSGALGNVVFELAVFAILALAGYGLGRMARRPKGPKLPA